MGYTMQAEKIRGSLLGFYEENRQAVPPAVAGEMGSKCRALDAGEAMGIPARTLCGRGSTTT